MQNLTGKFVCQAFQEYYKRDFQLEAAPREIGMREFGFVLFPEGVVRHKKFESVKELTCFLRQHAPLDVFYSCAYYEDPEADMEKKGWRGADLIFDIDADHIPTACERLHDIWICNDCKFSGKGFVPERCPICGGEKFEVKTWPCEVCLASAKEETIKLLDILTDDFGFSEDDINIFFSGNRGYHIHVECDTVRDLDSTARKEIVDYVSGIGLDLSLVTPEIKDLEKSLNLGILSSGWSRRLFLGVLEFLKGADEQKLREIGLKKEIVNILMNNKDVILRSLREDGVWPSIKKVGSKTLRKILEHVVSRCSAKIDTVVTTDVHRLIRLPETLNSRTGFKKTKVQISEFDDFDPFKAAIAFDRGTVKVMVLDAPRFRVGDSVFGPYREKTVELPIAAALLLVCRDRAEVVNDV